MKPLLCTLCVLLLAACSTPAPFTGYRDLVVATTPPTKTDLQRSIVAEISEVDDLVENGSAYEKISLKVPPFIREICVPNDIRIYRSTSRDLVTLLLKKQLGFAGHPGELDSIREERKNMWAAIQIRSSTLRVALYGSYDSEIEGGTEIDGVLFIPEGVKIRRQAHLNFFSNAHQDATKAYQPALWYVLPASPDPTHRYEHYAPPPESE